MTEWPVYQITFIEGTVVDILASGIGSAIIDACVIANGTPEAVPLSLGISDIVEVRQLGSVYISPSVATVTAKPDSPDVYDLTRRGPYDGN